MKTGITTTALILLCGIALLTIAKASTLSPGARHILLHDLWQSLYRNGGQTFFCGMPFRTHTVLVTESYLYPLSRVRASLHCATNRNCERHSATYRKIETDLHNIVPAKALFELRQRNARYADLGSRGKPGQCGSRFERDLMDPPDHLKGDIARAIAYMHSTYGLTLITPLKTLQRWNRLDPPSAAERARNRSIELIQGTENPYVSQPDLLNRLPHSTQSFKQARASKK